MLELALSVQALLLPPWQAVEPQTAGMVTVYDEARQIFTSMQNSSATASSGCIQCQLDNTTAAILVLQPKLSYPKTVTLLENQGVPSIGTCLLNSSYVHS